MNTIPVPLQLPYLGWRVTLSWFKVTLPLPPCLPNLCLTQPLLDPLPGVLWLSCFYQKLPYLYHDRWPAFATMVTLSSSGITQLLPVAFITLPLLDPWSCYPAFTKSYPTFAITVTLPCPKLSHQYPQWLPYSCLTPWSCYPALSTLVTLLSPKLTLPLLPLLPWFIRYHSAFTSSIH